MFALPLLPTCRACVPGRWIGVLVLAVALAVALAATAGRATAGFTLGPEVNLSNSPEPSGVAEVSPQGLAVDGEGRVIVVWNEFKSADSRNRTRMCRSVSASGGELLARAVKSPFLRSR